MVLRIGIPYAGTMRFAPLVPKPKPPPTGKPKRKADVPATNFPSASPDYGAVQPEAFQPLEPGRITEWLRNYSSKRQNLTPAPVDPKLPEPTLTPIGLRRRDSDSRLFEFYKRQHDSLDFNRNLRPLDPNSPLSKCYKRSHKSFDFNRSLRLATGAMPKLEVGDVDDPLEREADKVADRVMQMTPPIVDGRQAFFGATALPGSQPFLARRKCHSCETEDDPLRHTPADAVALRACSTCEAEDDELRRASESSPADNDELLRATCGSEPGAGLRGGQTSDGFASRVREQARFGGSPLPLGARDFLEPRLGAGLHNVVHADDSAGQLAKQVNVGGGLAGELWGPAPTLNFHEDRQVFDNFLRWRGAPTPDSAFAYDRQRAFVEASECDDRPRNAVLEWLLAGTYESCADESEIRRACAGCDVEGDDEIQREVAAGWRGGPTDASTRQSRAGGSRRYGGGPAPTLNFHEDRHYIDNFFRRSDAPTPDSAFAYDRNRAFVEASACDDRPRNAVLEWLLSGTYETSADESEIRRACAGCDVVGDDEIQREAAAGWRGGPASGEFAAQLRSRVRSGGRPLPDSARNFLEPRLGVDLGRLRLHDDVPAGSLAKQINARAFTLGQDIFFAPGQLRPHSASGMRLLAHEVAHTLQGFGSALTSQPPQPAGGNSAIHRSPEDDATHTPTKSRTVEEMGDDYLGAHPDLVAKVESLIDDLPHYIDNALFIIDSANIPEDTKKYTHRQARKFTRIWRTVVKDKLFDSAVMSQWLTAGIEALAALRSALAKAQKDSTYGPIAKVLVRDTKRFQKRMSWLGDQKFFDRGKQWVDEHGAAQEAEARAAERKKREAQLRRGLDEINRRSSDAYLGMTDLEIQFELDTAKWEAHLDGDPLHKKVYEAHIAGLQQILDERNSVSNLADADAQYERVLRWGGDDPLKAADALVEIVLGSSNPNPIVLDQVRSYYREKNRDRSREFDAALVMSVVRRWSKPSENWLDVAGAYAADDPDIEFSNPLVPVFAADVLIKEADGDPIVLANRSLWYVRNKHPSAEALLWTVRSRASYSDGKLDEKFDRRFVVEVVSKWADPSDEFLELQARYIGSGDVNTMRVANVFSAVLGEEGVNIEDTAFGWLAMTRGEDMSALAPEDLDQFISELPEEERRELAKVVIARFSNSERLKNLASSPDTRRALATLARSLSKLTGIQHASVWASGADPTGLLEEWAVLATDQKFEEQFLRKIVKAMAETAQPRYVLPGIDGSWTDEVEVVTQPDGKIRVFLKKGTDYYAEDRPYFQEHPLEGVSFKISPEHNVDLVYGGDRRVRVPAFWLVRLTELSAQQAVKTGVMVASFAVGPEELVFAGAFKLAGGVSKAQKARKAKAAKRGLAEGEDALDVGDGVASHLDEATALGRGADATDEVGNVGRASPSGEVVEQGTAAESKLPGEVHPTQTKVDALDDSAREAILETARAEEAREAHAAARHAEIDAQINAVIEDIRRMGWRTYADFFGLGTAAEATYHIARLAFLAVKKVTTLTISRFLAILVENDLIKDLAKLSNVDRKIIVNAYDLAKENIKAERIAHTYVATQLLDPQAASAAQRVISEVAEHERIPELDDWVKFSVNPGAARTQELADNLLDDISELRVALGFTDELDPNEVIRVGNDLNAEYHPVEKNKTLPSFDHIVTGGPVQRNIEVFSPYDRAANVTNFGKAMNHAADKIIRGGGVLPSQETRGLIEAAVVVRWPPSVASLRSGRIETALNGDVTLATGGTSARRIPKGNFFEDYVRTLNGEAKGAPPAGARQVDRLTVFDTDYTIIYIFRRDATSGRWYGESRVVAAGEP